MSLNHSAGDSAEAVPPCTVPTQTGTSDACDLHLDSTSLDTIIHSGFTDLPSNLERLEPIGDATSLPPYLLQRSVLGQERGGAEAKWHALYGTARADFTLTQHCISGCSVDDSTSFVKASSISFPDNVKESLEPGSPHKTAVGTGVPILPLEGGSTQPVSWQAELKDSTSFKSFRLRTPTALVWHPIHLQATGQCDPQFRPLQHDVSQDLEEGGAEGDSSGLSRDTSKLVTAFTGSELSQHSLASGASLTFCQALLSADEGPSSMKTRAFSTCKKADLSNEAEAWASTSLSQHTLTERSLCQHPLEDIPARVDQEKDSGQRDPMSCSTSTDGGLAMFSMRPGTVIENTGETAAQRTADEDSVKAEGESAQGAPVLPEEYLSPSSGQLYQSEITALHTFDHSVQGLHNTGLVSSISNTLVYTNRTPIASSTPSSERSEMSHEIALRPLLPNVQGITDDVSALEGMSLPPLDPALASQMEDSGHMTPDLALEDMRQTPDEDGRQDLLVKTEVEGHMRPEDREKGLHGMGLPDMGLQVEDKSSGNCQSSAEMVAALLQRPEQLLECPSTGSRSSIRSVVSQDSGMSHHSGVSQHSESHRRSHASGGSDHSAASRHSGISDHSHHVMGSARSSTGCSANGSALDHTGGINFSHGSGDTSLDRYVLEGLSFNRDLEVLPAPSQGSQPLVCTVPDGQKESNTSLTQVQLLLARDSKKSETETSVWSAESETDPESKALHVQSYEGRDVVLTPHYERPSTVGSDISRPGQVGVAPSIAVNTEPQMMLMETADLAKQNKSESVGDLPAEAADLDSRMVAILAGTSRAGRDRSDSAIKPEDTGGKLSSASSSFVLSDTGRTPSEVDDVERITREYRDILKQVSKAAGLDSDATSETDPPRLTADLTGNGQDKKWKSSQTPLSAGTSGKDGQPLMSGSSGSTACHQLPKEISHSDIDFSAVKESKDRPASPTSSACTEDTLDQDVKKILAKYGRSLSDDEDDGSRSPADSDRTSMSDRVLKLLKGGGPSQELASASRSMDSKLPSYLFDDPARSMSLPIAMETSRDDSLPCVVSGSASLEDSKSMVPHTAGDADQTCKDGSSEEEDKAEDSRDRAGSLGQQSVRSIDSLALKVEQILASTSYLSRGPPGVNSSQVSSSTSSIDYNNLGRDLEEIETNLALLKGDDLGSRRSSQASVHSGASSRDSARRATASERIVALESDGEGTKSESDDLGLNGEATGDAERRESGKVTVNPLLTSGVVPLEIALEIVHDGDVMADSSRQDLEVSCVSDVLLGGGNLRSELGNTDSLLDHSDGCMVDRQGKGSSAAVMREGSSPSVHAKAVSSTERLAQKLVDESSETQRDRELQRTAEKPGDVVARSGPEPVDSRASTHIHSKPPQYATKRPVVSTVESVQRLPLDFYRQEDLADRPSTHEASLSQRVHDILDRESPTRQAYGYIREAADHQQRSLGPKPTGEKSPNLDRYRHETEDDCRLRDISPHSLSRSSKTPTSLSSPSFSMTPVPKGPFSAFGNAQSFFTSQLNRASTRDFDKSIELYSPIKRQLEENLQPMSKETRQLDDTLHYRRSTEKLEPLGSGRTSTGSLPDTRRWSEDQRQMVVSHHGYQPPQMKPQYSGVTETSLRKGAESRRDVPPQIELVTTGWPAGSRSRPRAATDPSELSQTGKRDEEDRPKSVTPIRDLDMEKTRKYRPMLNQDPSYVESGTDDGNMSETTVESTHPGSDDARAPNFPAHVLGSSKDPPKDAVGVYGGHMKRLSPPEDTLGTIQEHPSFSESKSAESGQHSEDSEKARREETKERLLLQTKAWVHNGSFHDLEEAEPKARDAHLGDQTSDRRALPADRKMYDSNVKVTEDRDHGPRFGTPRRRMTEHPGEDSRGRVLPSDDRQAAMAGLTGACSPEHKQQSPQPGTRKDVGTPKTSTTSRPWEAFPGRGSPYDPNIAQGDLSDLVDRINKKYTTDYELRLRELEREGDECDQEIGKYLTIRDREYPSGIRRDDIHSLGQTKSPGFQSRSPDIQIRRDTGIADYSVPPSVRENPVAESHNTSSFTPLRPDVDEDEVSHQQYRRTPHPMTDGTDSRRLPAMYRFSDGSYAEKTNDSLTTSNYLTSPERRGLSSPNLSRSRTSTSLDKSASRSPEWFSHDLGTRLGRVDSQLLDNEQLSQRSPIKEQGQRLRAPRKSSPPYRGERIMDASPGLIAGNTSPSRQWTKESAHGVADDATTRQSHSRDIPDINNMWERFQALRNTPGSENSADLSHLASLLHNPAHHFVKGTKSEGLAMPAADGMTRSRIRDMLRGDLPPSESIKKMQRTHHHYSPKQHSDNRSDSRVHFEAELEDVSQSQKHERLGEPGATGSVSTSDDSRCLLDHSSTEVSDLTEATSLTKNTTTQTSDSTAHGDVSATSSSLTPRKKMAWVVEDEMLLSIPEHSVMDSISSDHTASSSVEEDGKIVTRTTKRHLPNDPKLLRLQQKIAKQKEKYKREHLRELKRKERIAMLEAALAEKGRAYSRRAEQSSDHSTTTTGSTDVSSSSSRQQTSSVSDSTLTLSDITSSSTLPGSTVISEDTLTKDDAEVTSGSTPRQCKRPSVGKAPRSSELVRSPRKVTAPRGLKLQEVSYRHKERPVRERHTPTGSYMEYGRQEKRGCSSGSTKKPRRTSSPKKREDGKQKRRQDDKSPARGHRDGSKDDGRKPSAPKHNAVKAGQGKPKPQMRDFGATCPTPVPLTPPRELFDRDVFMVSEAVQTSLPVETPGRRSLGKRPGDENRSGFHLSTAANPSKGMLTPENFDACEEVKTSRNSRKGRSKYRMCKKSLAWFVPLGETKPWRKPLAERQAYAASLDNWPQEADESPRHHMNPMTLSLDRSVDQSYPEVYLSPRTCTLPNVESREKVKSSLKQAFEEHMQGFISRSREREKHVALRAEERRLQELHRREREALFLVEPKVQPNRDQHPYGELHHKPQKRHFTRQEQKEITNRLYRTLPEVLEKLQQQQRRDDKRANRLRAALYRKRIQNHVLGRKGLCLKV